MSENKLELAARKISGKKVKQLRKAGLVPSVVFGQGEPKILQSPYNETERVLYSAGYHSPINAKIDGKTQMVLVKSVDIDPVKRTIRNVEFQAISANEVVEATTPIVLVGFENSEANKAHLTLSQVMEEIAVKAKPVDLPKAIEVDAAKLKDTEDRLTIADLVLPEGVELADKEMDTEQIVANVYDPSVEAAAREAEAEADKAAEEARALETAAPEAEASTEKVDEN